MNWCKTCKKELPMEPCCNVGPECSSCRADRLERELEEAQSSLAQREVQLKKALEELAAEKALREQAQLDAENWNTAWKVADKGRSDAQQERDEAAEAFEQLAANFPAIQTDCDDPVKAAQFINMVYERTVKDRDDLHAKLLAEQAAGAEMGENYQDLRNFVRAVCLLLQRHRGATTGEMDQMFQISYRLYTKHDVEHPLPTPLGTTFLAERERLLGALRAIDGITYAVTSGIGATVGKIARTALETK